MKTIEYFMIPSSPWTYLGHARLQDIAARHGASIEMKPFDLGKVFPLSGGLPLPKRAPQRQRYRLEELKRWRDALNVPMVIEPAFFPVAADDALRVIIAAQISHGADRAFALAGAIMKACWANQENIADVATLTALADEQGMEGKELIEQSASVQADLDRNTQEAIDTHVFGSPWYRVGEHNFWGQDRLEFVSKALS
ncbi:MAG: 2-hydroxychromene-2-carboxylate isomerase [Burkholderiaceae bacterium]